ncbi:MAG: PQQ-binding-like beta-propeller repeat protein, partial [Pyrinomonadaceae bacterium]
MKTFSIKSLMMSLAVIALFLFTEIAAQVGTDWPQWRGPNRDGISKETGLLKQWPEQGPALVWKATGAGGGYSSFAISNGRLFTMGLRGNREYVVAFNVATGKEAWATPHGDAFRNDRGDGP